MPSKSPKRTFIIAKEPVRRFHEPPVILGRPLIEGRDAPTFPAFYREEKKPVTFRSRDAHRSREEREDYAIGWLERVRREADLVMILIPHHIYSSTTLTVFHTGWTLSELDGEVRTHQCVVFHAGDAVPIGRADQGVLCVARCDELSAWDGRTEEESRARAA